MASGQCNLKYEIRENKVTITGMEEPVSELIIPAQIQGMPVDKIGDGAFYRCESLTTLKIPGSVKVIEEFAFGHCEKLQRVVFEDGLKSIGNYAFLECESLTEINLPYGTEKIGERAFGECNSLTVVKIPGSVKVIEDLAFDSCGKLQTVILEDGVEEIGPMAFQECPELRKVLLPNCLKIIERSAFSKCVNLTEIRLPNGIKKIGSGAFDECKSLTEITIPGSIEEVEQVAFYNCEKMEKVILEEGVTTIGEAAFKRCSSLKEIVIPDSVTNIAENAFWGCDSLMHEIPTREDRAGQETQETIVERKNIRKKLRTTKNIFISSTFRDMQAERDMVQEKVLPALRNCAKKYGENVGVIDLRWGVDTSALETDEGSAKVLSVCLDEIDRSHPYMLIFLGERYGWIPDGSLIEKAVSSRVDKYEVDDFEKSVTALEIEYGALSEKYGDLNHCAVCFREPVAHLMDGNYRKIYEEQNEKALKKLHQLKERIKNDLGADDRLISYSCAWDGERGTLTDFRVGDRPLDEVLVEYFGGMFQEDWEEYKKLTWQDREQLIFHTLQESKLSAFSGREELVKECYEKAKESTHPIILQGKTGSGKTSLMCKLIEQLEKEGENVFYFFSGAGSESGTAELLVKQMVYYLENLLDLRITFPEGFVPTYINWLGAVEMLCGYIPDGERYL